MRIGPAGVHYCMHLMAISDHGKPLENPMNKEKTTELANELKTIRRVKVYEEISLQIEGLIQNGKAKPGDKLPT